ncbi:MAG: Rdx family protein [Caldilineaceae bacterium]|nr:Rdx family protein [Caldilineaceae bacterium]
MRAVRAAAELLEHYTQAISGLKLIPSSGGRFEVLANDTLIYSKKAEGRHAEDGEVGRLFGEKLGM